MFLKGKVIFHQVILFATFLCVSNGFVPAAQGNDQSHIIQSASELDYPPFAIVRPDGTADGFSVDLLKAVAEAANLEVNIAVGPWHEIKQQLAEGRLDVLPLVNYTPERHKLFDFTAPYLQMHGTIFVRKGNKSIRSEADLKDKEVLVMRDDAFHEYAIRQNIPAKLVLTTTFTEAMELLSSGKYDAVLCQYLMGLQLIKKLGLKNVVSVATKPEASFKLKGGNVSDFSQKFCLAVPEGRKELLAQLNEGLAIVNANGTYEALYNKWFSPILPKPAVPLSMLVKSVFLLLGPFLVFAGLLGVWYLKSEVRRKTDSLKIEIEERKHIDKRLLASEKKYKQIFLENKAIKLLIDPSNGNILEANDAACDFYQYPKDTLLNMKITDLNTISPLRGQQEMELSKRMSDSDFHFQHKLSTGEIRDVEVYSGPISVDDGSTLLFSIIHDITERKRAQRELNITLRELSVSNRIRNVFLIATDEKMYEQVLDIVLETMDSKYGTFAYINEDGDRIVPSMTGSIWETCKMPNKAIHFPRKEWGDVLWAKCINEKRSLSSNGPFKIPDGHVSIKRALAVPILHRNKVIGNFMVGDKPKDYDKKDKELLENIANQIAPLLHARLQNEKHEQNRRLAESRIKQLARFPSENPGPVLRVGKDGIILYANNNSDLVLKKWGCQVNEQVPQYYCQLILKIIETNTTEAIEVVCEDQVFSMAFSPVIEDGYVNIYGHNITEQKNAEKERKKLEDQLRQAVKMQAVGTLAGGVAHEFNNLLGIIMGSADIARDEVPSDSFARGQLDRVLKASYRAKNLVKQILTFSRKKFDRKTAPLNLSDSIRESLDLIQLSIPSSVDINTNIDNNYPLILADSSEISQIIINLSSNAVAAMQEKGVLTISLEQMDLSTQQAVKILGLNPGQYLKLSVSDTGEGMETETKERVFEPFFTTKEIGKGTGMGLATVHGIMDSCRGVITVDSEPGKGTTFHLYFPTIKEKTVEKESTPPSASALSNQIQNGIERILFIDDEPMFSETGKDILESLGYRVTAETDSRAALDKFKSSPQAYDLVITDQIMPHLSGDDLTKEILALRDIPVILCTGHSAHIDEQTAKSIGVKEYLMKPFLKKDIAMVIRKVLNN